LDENRLKEENLELEKFGTNEKTPVFIEKKIIPQLPEDLCISTWGVKPFWQLVARRSSQ
jgi:hypothetical protein